MCKAHETTFNSIKEIVEILNDEIKEIRSKNRDIQPFIDSCNTASKKCAAYPEQRTEIFEKVSNITVDIGGVIPHDKHNGIEEDCQEYRKIPYDKKRQMS